MSEFLLKSDIDNLRTKRGCYPLCRIREAENLTSLIKYKEFSDEDRKVCLTALTKECFETEPHKAGMLLASLSLLDGYEGVQNPDLRRNQYRKEHFPKDTVVARTLRIRDDKARDEFVSWLINEENTDKINEIRNKIQKENTPKQRPVRKYKHNLRPREKNYKDREDQKLLLEDILEYFNNNQTAPNEQLIHGMGGMGKTQIAKEYAHRFESKYLVICWLTADTAFNNAIEFLKFMKPKEYERLQNIQDNSSTLIAAFRQWFEDNIGWLLIFDDVENKKQIESYIPHDSNGHILITSRAALKGIDKAISLKVFDEETAVSFLMSRAKCDDNEGAKSLALRLGCFPLALEQAAAYIEAEPGVDFKKYISKLEKRGLKFFDDTASDGRNYTHTVNTVWSISMEKVSDVNEAAAHLLYMCAYFAPDDIDFSIFVKKAEAFDENSLDENLKLIIDEKLVMYDGLHISLLHELRDETARRNLIRELTKYSLVDFDYEKNKLSMHGLLQEVIRGDTKAASFYIRCCLSHLNALDLIQSHACKLSEIKDTLTSFGKGNLVGFGPIIGDEEAPEGHMSVVGLVKDYGSKLPHVCSIMKYAEPFLYEGQIHHTGICRLYRLISHSYYALDDYSSELFYLRKALVFAYKENMDEKSIKFLANDIGHRYLDEMEEESEYKKWVDYDWHDISSYIEGDSIVVRIDFSMDDKLVKNPPPLIVNIPYPFKTALS